MNIIELPEDVHKEIISYIRGDFKAFTSTCKLFQKYATHAEIDARSHHLLTIIKIFPERKWDFQILSKRNITWDFVREQLVRPQSIWEIIKARLKLASYEIFEKLKKYSYWNIITLSLVFLSLSALHFLGLVSNKNKTLNRGLFLACMIFYFPLFCDRKNLFGWFDSRKFILKQKSIIDKTYGWDFKALSKNPNITWEIIMKNFYHPITGVALPWDDVEISHNPNITWEIVMNNPIHPITKKRFKWYWYGLTQNPKIDFKKIISLDYYYGEKIAINYIGYFPGLTVEIIDEDPIIANCVSNQKRLLSQTLKGLKYTRAAMCDLEEFSKLCITNNIFSDNYDYLLQHNTADKILNYSYNRSFMLDSFLFDELCKKNMVSIPTAIKFFKKNNIVLVSIYWKIFCYNKGIKFNNDHELDYHKLPDRLQKILSKPITWRVVKDNTDISWDFLKIKF